jgi:signal transduction histidine kinase
MGLSRALEILVERVTRASGVKGSTEIDSIDGLLEPEKEINAYRIVQESLNNAIKHSGASEVIVSVRAEPGLEISIFDNGCGFDREKRGKMPGLGLAGMEGRAKMLGGCLSIETAPGIGTRVTLKLETKHRRPAGSHAE